MYVATMFQYNFKVYQLIEIRSWESYSDENRICSKTKLVFILLVIVVDDHYLLI